MRIGEVASFEAVGTSPRRPCGRACDRPRARRSALKLYRALGDRFSEANTLTVLGHAYLAASDHDAAGKAWLQALTILDDHLDWPAAASASVDRLATSGIWAVT